uniref:Uncharacterized protein n=1 Tax=Mycena chlorophos TaxID=658473 RepID=A0ABQ0LAK7_MYCCL|nr:predicted protein [Mycena chlorophos]
MILRHMFEEGIVATGLRADAIAMLDKPDLPTGTALGLRFRDNAQAPPGPAAPISSTFGEFYTFALEWIPGRNDLQIIRDRVFVSLAAGGYKSDQWIMVHMRCYYAQGCSLWGSLNDLAWEMASWDDECPFESRSEEIRIDVEKIVEACGEAYV